MLTNFTFALVSDMEDLQASLLQTLLFDSETSFESSEFLVEACFRRQAEVLLAGSLAKAAEESKHLLEGQLV